MFGRYIFICKAVRRNASHEEVNPTNIERIPGEDLIDELINDIQQGETKQANYTKPSNNKNQNIMASGIYNYPSKEDETYGGYGETPNNSLGI